MNLREPPIRSRKRPAPKRIQDRILGLCIPEPNSGCWLWLGAVKSNGYGNVSLGGGKFTQAHRASYIAFVGAIPVGMVICHQCDNKLCVNPDHLKLGTYKDNSREARERGRRAPFYQRSSRSKSGVVGVGWATQSRRWKVWISNVHIGYFTDFDEAVSARKNAEASRAR